MCFFLVLVAYLRGKMHLYGSIEYLKLFVGIVFQEQFQMKKKHNCTLFTINIFEDQKEIALLSHFKHENIV